MHFYIENERPSRVHLLGSPARTVGGKEIPAQPELLVAPAEEQRHGGTVRLKPAYTKVSAEQRSAIEAHHPSAIYFGKDDSFMRFVDRVPSGVVEPDSVAAAGLKTAPVENEPDGLPTENANGKRSGK
jgi:hypothetical protein